MNAKRVPVDALTPREREVLRLLLKGKTNRETGKILGISPRTVEGHRTRIMGKLGATSQVELGVIAASVGALE